MARSGREERERLRARLRASGLPIAHVALSMGREFGVRPRTAWRYALGWAQWKLVQEYRTANPTARIGESRISRWESWPHGGARPSMEALSGLARAFGHGCTIVDLVDDSDLRHFSPAERGLISEMSSDSPDGRVSTDDVGKGVEGGQSEEDSELERRELLRLFTTVAAALILPTGSGRSAMTSLADGARFNESLWQVYALSSSKADALPLVRRQLSVLTEGLTASHTPDTRRRLCELIGDLFQLAGEIYFDSDAYTDAAHCYSLAAQANKEAGAYDQWACAMTRHAYLSVYERHFSAAAPLLDLAASLAARGDRSMSTGHWVAAVQAEVFAGLGDFDACQRALDAAEEVEGLSGAIHNGGWLRFDGTRLAEERGTCYVTLGRPDLAEAALTDALEQAPSLRRRAGILTDLAVVGAQQRDLDQVIAYADAAMGHARETRSGMVGRRLLGLRPHLVPLMTDKRAKSLDAEIVALATAPR